MIVVDQIQPWPISGRFRRFCHMTSDQAEPGGVLELVEFAAEIGLKKEWLQRHSNGYPHFDLVPSKRRLAVTEGAREISCREYVKMVYGGETS